MQFNCLLNVLRPRNVLARAFSDMLNNFQSVTKVTKKSILNAAVTL